jgi:hypothetical protein
MEGCHELSWVVQGRGWARCQREAGARGFAQWPTCLLSHTSLGPAQSSVPQIPWGCLYSPGTITVWAQSHCLPILNS